MSTYFMRPSYELVWDLETKPEEPVSVDEESCIDGPPTERAPHLQDLADEMNEVTEVNF